MKLRWLWGLCSFGLMLLVLWVPRAQAEDGYPYYAKPCVHAPYAVQGVRANWCPNYDWGDTPNNTSAANVISPYGYYYRNCTDYTAWRVSTRGVPPERYKGLGDAKTWAVRAPTKGARVDGQPAVGSVAVRTSGQFGHTAFVEEVRPDGTIRVSHYNYRATGVYSEEVGTPATFGFVAFVHFEDFQPPPPVTPPPPPAVPEVGPPPLTPSPAAQAEPAPVESPLAEPEGELTETTAEIIPEEQSAAVVASSPQEPPAVAAAVTAEAPPPEELETVTVVARAATSTSPPPKTSAAVVRSQPEGRGASQSMQLSDIETVAVTARPAEVATLPGRQEPAAPPKLTTTNWWSITGLAGCLALKELASGGLVSWKKYKRKDRLVTSRSSLFF